MIAASMYFRGVAQFVKPMKAVGIARNYFTVGRVGYQYRRLRRFVEVLNCNKCIRSVESVPIRVALFTPPCNVLNYGTDTGGFLSKDDLQNKNEDEVTDKVLNKFMSARNTDPDAYRHVGSIYAEKLCKAGKFTDLAKLLQFLREKHVTLSSNVYSIIFSAAGDANDADLLSQVFKDMLVSESVDLSSCVDTTKAFMTIRDNSSLVKFIQDISDLTPTVGVMFLNRIIYSLAGCGQVDKALLIYHTMKSVKCKPDLVTYNTVLGVLGRIGRVHEMLVEFFCMKESGIAPDIISFNTLINSLKKVGQLDLCLRYMKEMTESGLEPDLRTYTALIESYGRLGNVEEPIRLLEEMKLKGVRPSIYVYRSLIDNLKKVGKVEAAAKYLEEMKTIYGHLVGPKDFKRKRR